MALPGICASPTWGRIGKTFRFASTNSAKTVAFSAAPRALPSSASNSRRDGQGPRRSLPPRRLAGTISPLAPIAILSASAVVVARRRTAHSSRSGLRDRTRLPKRTTRGIRCVATWHRGALTTRPAGCASASREFEVLLRVANRVINGFPVRFSPLVSEGFGEAARQLPPHRRPSSAYTSSGSTHDPIGAVCPRCGPLVALEGRRRRRARRSDLLSVTAYMEPFHVRLNGATACSG